MKTGPLLLILGLCMGYVLGAWVAKSGTSPSLVSQSPQTQCGPTSTGFNCVTFVRNYDSDTITVSIPNVHPLIGDRIGIRVNGVDSPEIRGKAPCEKALAKEARDYVHRMLKKAKRIDLKNVSRGKYFRIVANVVADGEDLSQTLLARGYGTPYDGGTKSKVDWCELASRR